MILCGKNLSNNHPTDFRFYLRKLNILNIPTWCDVNFESVFPATNNTKMQRKFHITPYGEIFITVVKSGGLYHSAESGKRARDLAQLEDCACAFEGPIVYGTKVPFLVPQLNYDLSDIMTKPTKWPVRQAKLLRHSNQSSLFAPWIVKDSRFLHADSEDWSNWADARLMRLV